MRVLERTGTAAALVPERDNLGSRNLALGLVPGIAAG